MTMTTENAGTNEQPIKIVRGRTKNIGTPLTNREKAEKGELVAHLVQRIGEKEEAKKNAGAQLKAEIDQLKAELKSVSLEISCGVVFRDVAIIEKHIYQTGTYQEVRVDTGEIVLERALTEKERQVEIPGFGDDEEGVIVEDPDAPDSEDGSGPRNWTPDETDEESETATGGGESNGAEDEEPALATERRRKPRKGKAAESEAES